MWFVGYQEFLITEMFSLNGRLPYPEFLIKCCLSVYGTLVKQIALPWTLIFGTDKILCQFVERQMNCVGVW